MSGATSAASRRRRQDAVSAGQLGHRHGRAVREDAEERSRCVGSTVYGALGGDHGRHRRDAQPRQLSARFRVRLDVDGVERATP